MRFAELCDVFRSLRIDGEYPSLPSWSDEGVFGWLLAIFDPTHAAILAPVARRIAASRREEISRSSNVGFCVYHERVARKYEEIDERLSLRAALST